MQKALPLLGKRVMAVATASALALSMCAIPSQSAYAVSAKDVSGYVAATPTPMCLGDPEILGLSSVDERWGIEDGVTYDDLTNTSGGLRYLLMGTDEYNENANPYMYNTVYETDGVKTIQDSNRSGYSAGQFNRALAPYGTQDTDDAIWQMLPDVIIGVVKDNNETTDYTSEARGVEQALGLEANSYNPIGVYVNRADTLAMLYTLAEAANDAAEISGKSLRYGDAVEIAKDYESYVKGIQGYVLKQMAANGDEKKSVVLVTANDGNGTVTLETGMDSGYDYLGSLSEVATNFADTLTNDESISISVAQLEAYVANGDIDLIMLASDDNIGDGFVPTTGLENLFGHMYWTLDQDCGGILADNRGSDQARNFALLLGSLYPEYVDQSDWIAYYYDTVYHIKDNMIPAAIDRAMDGVRNWDVQSGDASAYVQWTESSVSSYNKSHVVSMIDEGLAYIESLGANTPESLVLTDYLDDGDEPATSFSDVSTGDWFYDDVEAICAEGLMGGYAGTDKFGPLDNLTRAQVAQIMFNYAEAGGENPSAAADRNTTGLSDLDATDWYTEACNWAVAEGFMGSGLTAFRPNDVISMQELVTVISRVTGSDVSSADASALAAYPDASSVSDWAVPYVAWGVQEGLVGNNTVLEPTVDIYRARVAAILCNAIDAGLM